MSLPWSSLECTCAIVGALGTVALLGGCGSSPWNAKGPEAATVHHWQRVTTPRAADACKLDAVSRAIEELDIEEVVYCDVWSFADGSEQLTLVAFAYGPAQDCPAGCFYAHAGAVVRGDHVQRVSERAIQGSNTSVYAQQGLRQFLPEEAPRESLDFWFGNGTCWSQDARLESQGKDLYWAMPVPTGVCEARHGKDSPAYALEVEGEVRVPILGTGATPGAARPDVSHLKARLTSLPSHNPR